MFTCSLCVCLYGGDVLYLIDFLCISWQYYYCSRLSSHTHFYLFFLRLIKWLPPLTLKCNKFIIIKIFSFSFVHHHHHLPSTQSSISSIYFFVWKLLHDHNKLVINNDDNRYWFHIQWLKIFYQLEVPHNNFLFVWNAIINAAVINFGGW